MDDDERLSLVNSADTSDQTPPAGDDNAAASDEEEALSLSDLPLIHQPRKHISTGSEDTSKKPLTQTPDDFDFCSKESEMSAADEIFHRGQILPFRHSLSSGKRLSQINLSRSISRSESMDCRSGPSRSSSISSGSGSSSSNYLKPPLNVFHSLPSPSPKLQQAPTSTRTNSRNYNKKSSAWNIFRLGLLTNPPKIAFHDLKTRTNNKNFGSRNSTSSNSSSLSSNSAEKKKAGTNLLGGCNCTLDAVDTVPCKVGFMKRSMSEGNSELRALQMEEEANLLAAAKTTKNRVSHHRTFEWLNQLSIDSTPDVP